MTNLTLEEKKELIRMALAAREKAYVPTAILWWALPCAPRMAAFLPAATWRTLPLPPPAVQNARLCSSGGRGCDRVHRHCCGGQPPRRGERADHFSCGVCRQALFEFGGPELNVIMAKTPEDFIERSMDELLPFGFGPSNVAGNRAVK